MFILHLSSIPFFAGEHRAGMMKKNVAPRNAGAGLGSAGLRLTRWPCLWQGVVQEVAVGVCVVLKLWECLDLYDFSLNGCRAQCQ